MPEARVELYQWEELEESQVEVGDEQATGWTSVWVAEPSWISVGTCWSSTPTHREFADAVALQDRIVQLLLVFGDEARRLAEAPVQLTNLPTRGENGELPSNVLREVPHAADPASRR